VPGGQGMFQPVITLETPNKRNNELANSALPRLDSFA
jgi:hypothetical protein